MRLTAKRLEDAALSYRGEDRVQLLRRWLVMLRETQRAAAVEKEAKRAAHPDQHLPVLDLYMDYETGASR
uniref:Rx N-terminal domain-containing protein n=1 Tax=Oryza glumipatula TaxID=40148 RepID=A0A0E0AUR9_9ORYZ